MLTPSLGPSQASMVAETLRVSLADAGMSTDGPPRRPPHPAWPAVGESVTAERTVTTGDTAAAMGHPDAGVAVLGSPRLALWFELVSCDLLPAPTETLSHVGVGILVHHLARADVGETVRLEAACASVSGRRAVFTCRATVGERLVGFGTHHRALLLARV